MYGCDAKVLLNGYSYLVFVGEVCLGLVPIHLPHLRLLCLQHCHNVCKKYIQELVATVPQLKIMK